MLTTPAGAAPPRDPVSDIIDRILISEGGYADRPADKGGPTKYGITIATLTSWRGRPVTADEVYRLSEAEARQVYRQRYVIAPGYAGIRDPQLAALIVDSAVLYGPDDASPWLQQAARDLGGDLKVDCIVGPKTLAVVNALDPDRLVRRICASRLRKMGRVIADDARARGRTTDQALNAAGWSNRLADFLAP